MTLAPGTTIGPYEITGFVGAGAMGEVHRARDSRLGREVAIKVLPAQFSADRERLRRFDQEARTAGTLNHRNILAIYDVGSHEGMPYVVSELLQGGTLRERMPAGGLPRRKALEYGVQVAEGLAAAQARGVIHRDLKPENLFVTNDGTVKILDFGLAKLVEAGGAPGGSDSLAGTMTGVGLIMGTVGYMAPEQARGLTADHSSDIFALGCVLYEMLTGVRAFHRDSPMDTLAAILNEDPPPFPAALRTEAPGLVAVILRCLEKAPGERFESARDLAFALRVLGRRERGGRRPLPRRARRPRAGRSPTSGSPSAAAGSSARDSRPTATRSSTAAPGRARRSSPSGCTWATTRAARSGIRARTSSRSRAAATSPCASSGASAPASSPRARWRASRWAAARRASSCRTSRRPTGVPTAARSRSCARSRA